MPRFGKVPPSLSLEKLLRTRRSSDIERDFYPHGSQILVSMLWPNRALSRLTVEAAVGSILRPATVLKNGEALWNSF